MTTRILHVATNVDRYDTDPDVPTGLWLSELTHAWEVFEKHGFEQTLASPAGGFVPLEPKSLKFPFYDASAKAWHGDPSRMALFGDTARADDLDAADFDAIYFTGGHGVMFDFQGSAGLQRLTREIFERGGVVGAVCHGYCGLLDVTLSDGTHLVDGRAVTGFSWREEVAAGVAKLVPYDVEAEIKARGAEYGKNPIPFGPHVVADGTLITGQNPTSAKKTAEKIVEVLGA
ncbi:type 1 glutamine amidotransferase domain-containing protein [Corynebacterium sp. NPDC060344]|uniref:type 1 glutamine amidotransferase domain-containing protein n=1 Tax=Corynebacterium sp. NPDC060344 TaxID=3347101 RepID=UPI00364FDB9D